MSTKTRWAVTMTSINQLAPSLSLSFPFLDSYLNVLARCFLKLFSCFNFSRLLVLFFFLMALFLKILTGPG